MKFEDYHIEPEIKRSIAALGFKKPTDIQYKSIPAILKREDVLAIAQTGTGKTAAFAIPVINLLHKRKTSKRVYGIRCVVMVPTHELALQITAVFNTLEKHTRVRTFAIYGGVDQDPQIARLEKGIDILVATPGRLFDLSSQGYLDFSKVEILILDEADHMLNLGFIKDIEHLIRFLPHKRQTLFFSATINDKIKDLAYSLVKKPIRIQVSPKDPVAKNITHSVAFIEMDDKRFFLERVINENLEKKILVFVRTKVRAERVAKAMERVGIISNTIHSGKDQEERAKVMREFRDGTVNILIATDISARGIDIPNVEFVINYDLPDEDENYVHRVGRTGRGKEKGKAISFCSSDEKPILEKIEKFLEKEIDVVSIDKADYGQTIDFANENKNDWKGLMIKNDMKNAQFEKKKKKRKK